MSALLNRLRWKNSAINRTDPMKTSLQLQPNSVCMDGCCHVNEAFVEPNIPGPSRRERQRNRMPSKLTQRDQPDARPALRRGDTFTLKDGPPDELPDHIKYATFRKNKPSTLTMLASTSPLPSPSIQKASIETDVFESLYAKRPLKTSYGPQIQPRSFQSALRYYQTSTPTAKTSNGIGRNRPSTAAPAATRPSRSTQQAAITAQTKTGKSSRKSTPKSSTLSKVAEKPTTYLFGSLEQPTTLNDPNETENDRYRTITLATVRRSFREKYLQNDGEPSTIPSARRPPIWFVDVNSVDDNHGSSADSRAYRSMANESAESKPRVGVSRADTFRIAASRQQPVEHNSNDDNEHERNHRPTLQPMPMMRSNDKLATVPCLLQRRDTFKVQTPTVMVTQRQSPAVDVGRDKGYFLQRYKRHVEIPSVDSQTHKVIPIGIAAPYNMNNDSNNDNDSNRRRLPPSPKKWDRGSQSPPQTIARQKLQSEAEESFFAKTSRPSNRTHPKSKASNGDNERKQSISFDALRKPAEATKDNSKTNLGFDRFYDPNYFVPKNQNLFGPLATAQMRSVNVAVQPKKRAWY